MHKFLARITLTLEMLLPRVTVDRNERLLSMQQPSPPLGAKKSSPQSLNCLRRKLLPSLGNLETVGTRIEFCSILASAEGGYCKAMCDVFFNDNFDLLALIFINWIDPMCCLAVLLTCKRFNSVYRLHMYSRGPVHSYTSLYCSRLQLIEWSVDIAAMPTGQLCNYCAEAGNLEALKYLRGRSPPCPWSEGTCAAAARGGHLVTLMWMRRQDPPCPWSERTSRLAVEYQQLIVLHWLLNQSPPCPMDNFTTECAHRIAHDDMSN